MRIRRIFIGEWRHFRNIDLQIDDDTGLVCIVGANGTGKSHLLELIAACAHRLGLSQGIEIPRGDPFSDPHRFELEFFVAPNASDEVEVGLAALPDFGVWNRCLSIRSESGGGRNQFEITAGGIEDRGSAIGFANGVIGLLQASRDVFFLSLDADRAYPKKTFNSNQIAEAYEIEWEGSEYTRGRSFRSSSTLYEEWIKYFLAQENQSGTRLITETRRARQSGAADPRFEDHFEPYRDALRRVLPHVVFAGVDSKKRTLLFDTTGLELRFDQLSGGEREIAFLLGQIDRFRLRNGLFLLDEPELHLNADLIRSWVAYLTGTVETGQIWLATHSLEAVEAAGQHATFILERNEATRTVDGAARLDTRPVLSALSRSVGTPAFSISSLRFVFVEGEESLGERERFRKLMAASQDVRIMECGSGNEVVRRVTTIKALAQEADTGIRLGGVVDRDFKSGKQVTSFAETGVFVLDVHEVENLFLHVDTLRVLLQQNGLSADPIVLIRNESDERAGGWIFQYALATDNAKTLPDMPTTAKDYAKSLAWSDFEKDREGTLGGILGRTAYPDPDQAKLRALLEVGVNAYARTRTSPELWKKCEGKQVLNSVARSLGFGGVTTLVEATFVLWTGDGRLPAEVRALRSYLQSL